MSGSLAEGLIITINPIKGTHILINQSVPCPDCKFGFCDSKTANCICDTGFHGIQCDIQQYDLGYFWVASISLYS